MFVFVVYLCLYCFVALLFGFVVLYYFVFRFLMVGSCRADLKDQSSLFIMQIRWLWREQWPFKVSKRISRRMRDILWGGVQPIMVRGGVQPIITTTTITRSRWHGGVGKLNFQPYCKGRSGTGEKETHYINVVGKTQGSRLNKQENEHGKYKHHGNHKTPKSTIRHEHMTKMILEQF